ncbi:hypothetical protein P3T76_005561 [Phytophthora citrophthora]|uniref:RxLR effector protein n=1 Tax=Phytophthora citrophthora TaxID=4793 RepID=A0AAD9LQB7_9STRA|nr:hypothetical protein P3T76_005561 [Phytophthora citrophthora]
MELKKTVFLLLAASFALLASSDSFVTSNELDKSFKMSTSSELQPSSSNLRRGLKYIDDEEERGINIIGGIQASIAARQAKRAAAKLAHLEAIKTAMLNGKLSQFTNSEFAKYFVAGKYVDDVVKTLRTAGKSEDKIATFAKNYKAWIKEIKKVNLKRLPVA